MDLIEEFEKNIVIKNKITLNDFIILYQSFNEVSKYCFDNNIDLGTTGWSINFNLIALEPFYLSYTKIIKKFVEKNGTEKDGQVKLDHTCDKGKEFMRLDEDLKNIEREFPVLEQIKFNEDLKIPSRMLIILQRYGLLDKNG